MKFPEVNLRSLWDEDFSSLPLLVARVAANHVNPTFSTDNFTIFTNSFDAGADLHRRAYRCSKSKLVKLVSICFSREIPQGPKIEQTCKKRYLSHEGAVSRSTSPIAAWPGVPHWPFCAAKARVEPVWHRFGTGLGPVFGRQAGPGGAARHDQPYLRLIACCGAWGN